MKKNLLAILGQVVSLKASILIALLIIGLSIQVSCKNSKSNGGTNSDEKIVYVHDTIAVMPEGEFVFNLPCKVVNIHQEKEGKSLLFIWLHGGVKDRTMHDLFETSHFDCCRADDKVLNYLHEKNIKSIALFPICHKAEIGNCVAWKDCYGDVMKMIRDYEQKGIVDTNRIYLAGSSDGGTGTWDFLQISERVFAAAMPMSCGNPRKTTIPVYFFNTRQEPDCTQQVESLNKQGSNIEYKRVNTWHGGDDVECTRAFLDRYFSNIRK